MTGLDLVVRGGTVATASFVVRSSTEMVSSYRLVTHAVSPVVSTTTPWGPDPVVMLSVTVMASVSMTDTVSPAVCSVP